ncbi:hypothetical protein ABZ743_28860 [Streptomyces sp. NPDC006662]|uniref:hypothetical protein n=1 Tax=Streptomyces sp. NPDC006662 TaxID=3156902 RepID=UPI0033E8D2A6
MPATHMAMCERLVPSSSCAPTSAATLTKAAATFGCDQPVSAIASASFTFRSRAIVYLGSRKRCWQRQYQQVEDELNDPRALALPDWETLQALAKTLVARSYGRYQGWGDVVTFAASTAARIGEVS